MSAMQIISAIVFFVVFFQLFIVLSIYLWKTFAEFFPRKDETKH